MIGSTSGYLFGCDRINDDVRRWQLNHRWTGHEALWMPREARIKGELLGLRHFTVTPGEHLLRCIAGEPGMMMVEVVPVEI